MPIRMFITIDGKLHVSALTGRLQVFSQVWPVCNANALLFMCLRGVIHSMGDSQDIRFMGSLSLYFF
jgi:hypothetical protein